MNEPIRIYVGTDLSQMLAVRVLAYSIGKHTNTSFQIYPLLLNLPVPRNKKNVQRTGFSFSRFAIPELAGFKGRAIYLDADMLVFGDISELWSMPFNGAKLLIQEELPARSERQKRYKQTSVCLLDCGALDWDVYEIIAGLESDYDYADLLTDLCIMEEEGLASTIPFKWNSLEYWDEKTCNLHFTDMNMQPWVTPVNKNSVLWVRMLREMLEKNLITESEIESEISRGYVRPSLIHEINVPENSVPVKELLLIDRSKNFVKHRLANEAVKKRKRIERRYLLETKWSGLKESFKRLTFLNRKCKDKEDKWDRILELLCFEYSKSRLPLNVWTLEELTGSTVTNVMILLDLVQDLEIMKPIIVDFQKMKEVNLQIVLSAWLRSNSPRVTYFLDRIGQSYSLIDSRKTFKTDCQEILRGMDVLLLPSESNLPPHKLAHHMAKQGNNLGIKTITFQHGLENVGLTYFDDKKAYMSSSKIIIWNDKTSKSDKVEERIRGKCVPMGIFKPQYGRIDRELVHELSGARQVVGIFENLHWERYDDDYRNNFLDCIAEVSNSRKDTYFVIKAHHAGKWSRRIGQDRFGGHDNLKVVDLDDAGWEIISGNQLVTICDCVITTPSTIAVDAAIHGLPVAVIANDIKELELYEPLKLLRKAQDWYDFLDSVEKEPNGHAEILDKFRDKTYVKLNPVDELLALLTQ